MELENLCIRWKKSDQMFVSVRKFFKVCWWECCAQFFRNCLSFLKVFFFCIRHWIVLKDMKPPLIANMKYIPPLIAYPHWCLNRPANKRCAKINVLYWKKWGSKVSVKKVSIYFWLQNFKNLFYSSPRNP